MGGRKSSPDLVSQRTGEGETEARRRERGRQAVRGLWERIERILALDRLEQMCYK